MALTKKNILRPPPAGVEVLDKARSVEEDEGSSDTDPIGQTLFEYNERHGYVYENPSDRSLYNPRREFEKLVNEVLKLDCKRSVQKLAAGFVLLSDDMYRRDSYECFHMAVVGIRCLQQKKVGMAKRIYRDLHVKLSTTAALGEVLIGLMLFLSVCFLMFYTWIIFDMVSEIQSGEDPWLLRFFTNLFTAPHHFNMIIAGLCGIAGSVVSILLRLAEFEKMIGRSRQFLRLTGFSLPLIGGAFGVVIAALLESRLINLTIGDAASNAPLDWHIFFVVGFLCGFSERLARGLLTAVESQVVGTQLEVVQLAEQRTVSKRSITDPRP